jgi:hypothetical protein
MLRKETLRDLTADHAADVRGGGHETNTCIDCSLGGCNPTLILCHGKTANYVTRKQWGC